MVQSNAPDGFKVVRALPNTHGGGNDGILLVRNRRTGELLIEKKLPWPILSNPNLKKRERDILADYLDHKNIVRLRFSTFASDYRYGSLFLEYCELGSVENLIDRYRSHHGDQHIGERYIWDMFSEMAAALAHIHSRHNPVLHMDVKPGNFLMSPAENSTLGFVLKLADFGFSEVIPQGHRYARGRAGTHGFIAPDPCLSAKSDIYSLGITINCLLRRSNSPSRVVYQGIRYSEQLKSLVAQCMSPDPDSRPSSNLLHRAIRVRRVTGRILNNLPAGGHPLQ